MLVAKKIFHALIPDDLSVLSNDVVEATKTARASAQLPVFTEQPVDSFVVRARPAILNCSVLHSDKAYFSCNGEAQSKSQDHVEKDAVDAAGRVVRILSIVIYREQVTPPIITCSKYLFIYSKVEEFFDEFRCQCEAWSSRGLTSSKQATVAIGCK